MLCVYGISVKVIKNNRQNRKSSYMLPLKIKSPTYIFLNSFLILEKKHIVLIRCPQNQSCSL